ncbi:MAG: hypothetical protein C0427_17045 [Rhodobacter sp.]|nr:hypothetical protein [Rhodobacter sp.]
MIEKSVGWFFAAWEDSESWDGPHASREAAISAGRACYGEEDGFCVCEAFNGPLDLNEYARWHDFLERAEEAVIESDRINTEYEEGPFFDVTPEQAQDLETHLRHAVTIWQEKHGLQFVCRTFSDMRNMEHVPAAKAEVIQ